MAQWSKPLQLSPEKYKCGYCCREIASAEGWHSTGYDVSDYIYICPYCNKPTYFDNKNAGKQYPGVRWGEDVAGIPSDEVRGLYDEARDCMSVGAFSCAILACRKMLMNIAVSKGASPRKEFRSYVDYLVDNGHVPEGCRFWVDEIRKKGNEATHEIYLGSEEDAEQLLTFVQILLKIMYEFPSRLSPPDEVPF